MINEATGDEQAGDDFFTVVVEGGDKPRDAFIQVFWIWARDIGDAIDRVAAVARDAEGIADPLPSEADRFDYASLPDDAREIGGTRVFTTGARFHYPADEPVFRLPRGVILSCLDGDYDPDELRAGYCRRDDDGLLCMDCVVPDGMLEEAFHAMVKALPSIRVSWIECSSEWEDAETAQFYSNEELNSPSRIRSFLRDETANVLRNGMVKFTVYSDVGQTNLLVTDHKELGLLTYSEEVADAMRRTLDRMGLEENNDLKSISRGLHHWHYRPADALPRLAFVEHLLAAGFSLWKELPAKK